MIEGGPSIGNARIKFVPELYGLFDESACHEIRDAIMGFASPDDETILLLGHNYGWEMAVNSLCGTEGEKLKTADAALMEARDAHGSWSNIVQPGGFRHVETLRARKLAGVSESLQST